MQILSINIASHQGLIACVTNDAVIAATEVNTRISDAELVAAIEKTLKEAHWTYQDLTHLACVTGPGGFTSLRIAVACANTLADQLEIPSAGIQLSDLYEARIPSPNSKVLSPILWLHSTKKHELFIRSLNEQRTTNNEQRITWPRPVHITLDEALQRIPEGSMWCGELLPEHIKALSENLPPTPYPLPPTIEILPSFLSHIEYAHALLKPWYGRDG